MDVATRFHPHSRTHSYLDAQRNAGVMEESGGESESNRLRRKFQRRTSEADDMSDTTFRKPSLPASATRAQALEHRPSLSQRRRSTLRENGRIPSGPRDYPSSPAKQRLASTTSTAPSLADATNTTTAPTRSFLPAAIPNADSFLFNSRAGMAGAHDATRLSFGNTHTSLSADDTDSPVTPAERIANFDFLPDVNFDDLQTSLKDYEGNSPLLNQFPTVDGGRALPKEEVPPPPPQQQQKRGLERSQSLRQRLGVGRQSSANQQTAPAGQQPVALASTSTMTLRGRRQSSVPQSSSTTTAPPASVAQASKPPRKSTGPGLIASMMSRNGGDKQNTAAAGETGVKPALARSGSLSTKGRRATVNPAGSAGGELPRTSTLTATTQSRQNKVKSLQPAARDQQDPNTPSSAKSASKPTQNRAHTPSSSGNKRQSMASGRASGLGARTISPTDARRLKRISMMNAPPMPTAAPKAPPTPAEEIANPMQSMMRLPELPILTQPSPSLIPRRTSSPTPSSARGSPEGRQGYLVGGGVSLSSKSSYSSLMNATANGSSSRLPTPKPRSIATQSNSSLAQYSDQYGDAEREELVPPVPAIPKAYESPKDQDHAAFFSSLSSMQSGFSEPSLGNGLLDNSSLPSLRGGFPLRSSFDVPSEAPTKRSGEFARSAHKRNSTYSNAVTSVVAPAGPRSARAQPDPNGRKNNNLQPLRLPPLNLMPINVQASQSYSQPNLPRPSLEVETRGDGFASVQTPEPKRTAKTPSTPMTASKATFFRRQEEQNKALRSASSHYALRDVMGMDADGNLTNFWDDIENENAGAGVSIPYGKQRMAITPFASGSLPKSSGEFARGLASRPSGEYEDEYNLGPYESMQLQNAKPQGPRKRAPTGGTVSSVKSSATLSTEPAVEGPAVADPPSQLDSKKEGDKEKKEGIGGGLRRKLSIGWRRSSSKAANHADNKNSPQQPQPQPDLSEKDRARLTKRGSAMPPPKLPASATWDINLPNLPASARPSLETGHARRKSFLPASVSSTSLGTGEAEQPAAVSAVPAPAPGMKTRSLHSEQPTPANGSTSNRASSWGTLGTTLRSASSKQALPSHAAAGAGAGAKHRFTASTLSAVVKDKDDVAADDEMQRLSRKRKDVDAAARESEELKKRALARSPMSAEQVLYDRNLSGGSVLNVFERGEVVDYEAEGIYFTGTRATRKIIGSLTPSPQPPSGSSEDKKGGSNNFGYDDERGDYNIILGDHLAYRYEVIDVLGKGSFGQVVRCVDHRDGGVVAVKIIRNKKRFHQQAMVEVGILGRLREWDPDSAHATLSITASFYFRSHLCIVTPCLSINLYELIRAHNFTGFSLPLIRRFSRQLLACLVLLQTKRIIHCDLKPENILLCEARRADVRVIDFGSSCREEEKVYTYIQSRFYRSPEVILGSSYGLGIDMWSLGCILAELWTGYPLFPGENEQEQLACIMEIFGPPDRHLVERCSRKKLFFDSVGKPRVTVSSKGRRRRPSSKTLAQALKSDDEAFVDFVARCLRWDPERRLKPSEAVLHPFITNSALHQRPGIPDEARRAARVRSSVAVGSSGGGSVAAQGGPSPVKKGIGAAANSSSSSLLAAQGQAATPAKDYSSHRAPGTRGLPETPQTAVRNGPTSSAAHTGSPIKPTGGNRRHSSIASATAAAAAGGGVAGSKRASNGAVLAGHVAPTPASGLTGGALPHGLVQGGQRVLSGPNAPYAHAHPNAASGADTGVGSVSLAQMAARESMGAASAAAAGGNGAGSGGGGSSARWRL